MKNFLEAIKSLPRPIAVFACNDRAAREVVSFCHVADLHVPDDVAILGVDDEQVVCESSPVPISSIKSYTGHTLGACGSLEAAMLVKSLQTGWYPPTLNLATPDPACAELDYVAGEGRQIDAEYAMSNNFAFGGVNTSLIFARA